MYAGTDGVMIPKANTQVLLRQEDNKQFVHAHMLGHYCYWRDRLDMLPLAVQSLLSTTNDIQDANVKSDPVWTGSQGIETQLAECMIQLLHALNPRKADIDKDVNFQPIVNGVTKQHIKALYACLSTFKSAEQYNEASMWGRLLTTRFL